MTATPSASQWNLSTYSNESVSHLVDNLDISELLAIALIERGITDPLEADRFLNPKLSDLHDPKLLPDFDLAVKHILGAKERQEVIFLHGDYDVDGVTSTALLYRFLTRIGCTVIPHVPHRMNEGYGIAYEKIDDAAGFGAKLFLTCDCGASALEQVERAREIGMDVVVTDHHHVGAVQPRANAFVNPHRSDSKYPFADLCGVGVAFKLCQGIAAELGLPIENFQRAYLDLATLGTVADVMPLIDENRILVRHGLPLLAQTKKPGLVALYREANLIEKARSGFDTYNVGFGIGPRLNAAGRIDDADLSLQLLLAESDSEAAPIAKRLEQLNNDRRAQQEAMVEEAIQQVLETGQQNAPMILVGAENWHKGIVGIVAGKIREKFNRPTFVLTHDTVEGIYSGSGRSIPGFHLARAIEANSDIISGGGHEKAAGMSFKSCDLEQVKLRLMDYAGAALKDVDFIPQLQVTAEADLRTISMKDVEDLAKLEPFGEANRRPLFVARNVCFEQVKPTKNPEHPRLDIRPDGGAIATFSAFNLGSRLADCPPGVKGDVVFELSVNEWNGRRSVQYSLKDYSLQ